MEERKNELLYYISTEQRPRPLRGGRLLLKQLCHCHAWIMLSNQGDQYTEGFFFFFWCSLVTEGLCLCGSH